MAYDEIRFAVPPPGLPATGWQTKDLGERLVTYRIDADGTMFYEGRGRDVHLPYTPEGPFQLYRDRALYVAHVAHGRVVKVLPAI